MKGLSDRVAEGLDRVASNFYNFNDPMAKSQKKMIKQTYKQIEDLFALSKPAAAPRQHTGATWHLLCFLVSTCTLHNRKIFAQVPKGP